MQYSLLGKTGINVSRIALGTVELGIDYGFHDSIHRKKPTRDGAIRIVHRALDLGINLIDSAPTYGCSEELIGEALFGMRERPLLATKVIIPEIDISPAKSKDLHGKILNSIEASLRALKVERLDFLQIHNTNPALLASDEVMRALEDACSRGTVRFLGASCVGEPVSEAALATRQFAVLQLPFNILDQQMLAKVFPEAREQGVAILARSAFLRGVLTDNFSTIPEALTKLKKAAGRLREECNGEVSSLSELALRFCLSFQEVSSVIIGVRSISELEANVANSRHGDLSKDCLRRLLAASLEDRSLVNPATWHGLI